MTNQKKFKTDHIVVRVTPALKRQIERAAAEDDRNVAAWARRAFLTALKNPDSLRPDVVRENVNALSSR